MRERAYAAIKDLRCLSGLHGEPTVEGLSRGALNWLDWEMRRAGFDEYSLGIEWVPGHWAYVAFAVADQQQ